MRSLLATSIRFRLAAAFTLADIVDEIRGASTQLDDLTQQP